MMRTRVKYFYGRISSRMGDRVGQQLGNYHLVQLIGHGGFADVYLAEHVYLNTKVAIKILQAKVADDGLETFLKEARTIASLVHPHIVRVTDFGVASDTPFLVMDFALNGTLRQRHPKGSQLPLTTIVPYVRQVAEALQYAHDEKFIHRDIKPENMLLGRRDEVLLSDFGIADIAQSSRYQGTQEVAGTVAYMAPEQIQGKPRPASDQYALGIVIYEWLSGDRPFRGSFTELCAQHIFAPPPSLHEKMPEISLDVEQVVMTALSKDPRQRFKSIQAFANALEQASRPEEPAAGRASQPGFTASPALLFEQQAKDPSLVLLQNAEPALSPSTQAAEVSTPPAENSPLSEIASRGDEEQAAVAVVPEIETPGKRRLVSWDSNALLKWGIGLRAAIAVVLGVILYAIPNYFIDLLYKYNGAFMSTGPTIFNERIDTGLFFIGLALIIPLFLGAISGPWSGLLIILAGTYFGDLLSNYSVPAYYGLPWTWWYAGYILIGFIAGLAIFKTLGRYNTGRAIIIAVATGAVAIIIGSAFIAYTITWVLGGTSDVAWSGFIRLSLSSAIDLVLLPILLVSYNAIANRILPSLPSLAPEEEKGSRS
jgi:serine/threonine protein kinase